MKPKILEEHDNEFLIFVDGKIKSIPNTSYSKLKNMYFENNRIMYKFADFVEATETFNPRIFNLMYDNLLITVRQDMSERVCKSIEDHFINGDYTKFKELFLEVYSEEHEDEIVESFILAISPYVRIEKKEFKHNTGKARLPVYIVKESFAIDSTGVSYYRREDDNTWQFLCTIVQSANQSYRVPLKKIGWAKLSETMSDIISKIIFFLHPNINDGVFTGQLKEHAKLLYNSLMDGTYQNVRKV